jgi:uncharacterized protein YdeI (YjbR/CyaY-like superfamily)
MKPRFFKSPAAFRAWLSANHAKATELLVGFYKKDSGKPSMTWPESVDEALCVGWIDGVRKRIDDDSYSIRFSPRRSRSIWSAVNIVRVRALTDLGLMKPAGLEAFQVRQENRSGIYTYEQRSATFPEPYAATMKKHKAAWTFFQAQPPGYRKKMGWWVVSAKLEATRAKRLEQLIEESARGRRM